MAKRQPGRPFSTEITTDLLEAAEIAMERGGYSNLTVDNLVTEAGTTRATFYRRFAGAAHLAFEVIAGKFGDTADVDTGSLLNDLTEIQHAEVKMLSSRLLRNNFAGLLEAMRTDEHVRELYRERFLEPRRENVRRAVERATTRGEVPKDREIDFEFLGDLLVGPVLARVTMPSDSDIDADLAARTAGIAFQYVTGRAPETD